MTNRLTRIVATAAGAAAIAGVLAPAALAQTPAPTGRVYVQVADDFKGKKPRLHVESMNPDGSDRKVVVKAKAGEQVTAFAVSRDGQSIAWVGLDLTDAKNPARLYVAPVAGGEPRRIEAGQWLFQGLDFSAEGSTLLTSRFHPKQRPGSDEPIPAKAFLKSELYTYPVAGGAPKRLTTNKADDYSAVFGPDGRIYYASDLQDEFGGDLWSIGADGTGARRLEHGKDNAIGAVVSFADGHVLLSESNAKFTRFRTTELTADGVLVRTVFPSSSRTKALFPITFSADSQQIAAVQPTGVKDAAKDPFQLKIVPVGAPTTPSVTITPGKKQQFLNIAWAQA